MKVQPKKFVLRDANVVERAVEYLRAMPLGEPLMELVVRGYRLQRSLEQNACSWAIYTAIGNDLGNTPQDIHDYALEDYSGVTYVDICDKKTGEVLHTVKRFNTPTSQMTVREFSNYIDWLIAWGQDKIDGPLTPVANDYDWRAAA